MTTDVPTTASSLATELRIVHDVVHVVARGPYDVDELVDRICGEIRTAFGFERALLVRYDAQSRTLFAVVQQGVEWQGDQWLLLDKFPFLVEALDRGRAVFVEDARAARAIPSKIIERFGVHSIVGVPLLVEGDCLGFIVADRKEGGGRFALTPGELAFLTTVGGVAGVLIAKAQQYAELQRALADVQQLERAKSDFISIASHELRTPIAAVHGISTTLHRRREELSDEQRTALVLGLYDATSRLRKLAQQLLDLSQLDAGAVALEPETFDVLGCLETLVQETARERASEVQLEVPPTLEVTCDTNAFERVVSNLLVNALRYGRPPVLIRASRGQATAIEVEDRGRGIDPAFAPDLFERFTRSDEARRSSGGAGLGLAIARSFARSLGGDLTYQPAQPTGARFTLTLPS
jgi:signal transduction histidine kinase